MASIKDVDTSSLLYEFSRQFPTGVSTFACCPVCSASARGGNFCRDCIAAELRRRGATDISIDLAKQGLIAKQQASLSYESAVEEIRRQIAEQEAA